MKYVADSFCTIGSDHKDNQDYALAVSSDTQPVAIVCDGCSSAENSDIGARILARTSLEGRYRHNNISEFLAVTLGSSSNISRSLNLDDDALCATLLIAWKSEIGLDAIIVGDGLVAVKEKGGQIWGEEVCFDSGAPFYLRYNLDDKTKQNYISRFGRKTTIKNYNHEDQFKLLHEPEVHDTLIDDFYRFDLNYQDNEFIAVMSDGVSSFMERIETPTGVTFEPVPVELILKELLDFKSYNGHFVQRRCNKAFKTFAKRNWVNFDDFSIAVIAENKS